MVILTPARVRMDDQRPVGQGSPGKHGGGQSTATDFLDASVDFADVAV